MNTAMFQAVSNGDVEQIRHMMAAGADVNARDSDGFTLLMMAANAGHLPVVQALLEAGAEVNASDAMGWTALTKSIFNADVRHGFFDVAQALVHADAPIEAPLNFGIRPLMLAAGYGETAIVDLLLHAGADVLAKNDGGYSALMMAKQKHHVHVINLLHEAEQLAGVGEGSCSSKNAPNSHVITFLKRT